MILTSGERRALRHALAMSEVDRPRFALAIGFGTLGLGSAIALSAVSAWLIVRASQMPPVLELSVAATSVRAFGIGKALFRYLERLASHRVALSGMTNLRTALYSRLADSTSSKLASLRRGDILARTGADVDTVGDVYVKAILPAAIAATTSIISVGIVAWLSPIIGVALAACLLLSALASPLLAGRGARAAQRAHDQAQADLAALSLALLEGADELRVSGRLADMEEEVRALERTIQQHRDRAATPTAWAHALDTLALGLAVLAALLLGIPQLGAGTINGIELGVAVLTSLAAFEGTSALGGAAVALVRGGKAAARIEDLLMAAPEAERASVTDLDPVIEATDLVVGWPGGPEVAGPFTFTLRPGQTLALVGASGSGKTTLLATLTGVIPPKSGSATIGGMAAHRLTPTSISTVVTSTAEDAHLFHTSVLENIRVARGDISEDDALEVLDRAGLSEWVDGLAGGVHHVLGSDGTTVSGGERRRLLLARALATRSPIVALDEPGEHVDPLTADRLTSDLLGSGLGVLLVTHRLSALGAADEVIVVGTGQRGSHADLVASSENYRWTLAQEKS